MLNEAVAQSSPGDQVTIRELQSQLLHLARQNQELHNLICMLMNLFQTNQTLLVHVSSINQVLAVLQEEVQNLRDAVGRKSKKGKKQNDSSESSDSESLSLSDHEFAVERKLMRLKGYAKTKVPQLLKSAVEMRGWKNSLISQIVACRKGSKKELLSWLSSPLELLSWLSSPLEGVELSSDKFPVLNPVLGSKLLEAAKGGRFGVDFQASQERSVRQGMQVHGHVLLGRICQKFRLDEERGMSLSQQHLLALKPQGVEIKDLEVFRDRVDFVLSSLETSEYPNEAILRSWLYECLKNVPTLALQIDKFITKGSLLAGYLEFYFAKQRGGLDPLSLNDQEKGTPPPPLKGNSRHMPGESLHAAAPSQCLVIITIIIIINIIIIITIIIIIIILNAPWF